jgi:hypothetical protein
MKLNIKELGPVHAWGEIQDIYDTYFWNKPFVFRGHACEHWSLTSSLERAHLAFNEDLAGMQVSESGLLRQFKRRFYHYVQDCPEEDDLPEWLAAMQHFGAPTRLLDVTHSFFVALFFAVESFSRSTAAVWAFDVKWISGRSKDMYSSIREIFDQTPRDQNLRKVKNFNEVFMSDHAMVCPLAPFRLNERMTIQQGWFLGPGSLRMTFVENLAAMNPTDGHLIKILIADDLRVRTEFIARLHRMNMNRATLFPGLEGFAESLKTSLAFPEVVAATPTDRRK